uniref:Protein FAR1-RELATED SEQUENCE 6-like n=1 Tax=Rhizophora mucronata TaxID=61149 RepID=A0A2P2JSG2_RHIMU
MCLDGFSSQGSFKDRWQMPPAAVSNYLKLN